MAMKVLLMCEECEYFYIYEDAWKAAEQMDRHNVRWHESETLAAAVVDTGEAQK